MTTEILYQGSMPVVLAHLAQGEVLKAEAGAMVYMDPTVDVEGRAKGGLAKGLGRMITGESFFCAGTHCQTRCGQRNAGSRQHW